MVGPLKKDLGVYTFLAVIMPAVYELVAGKSRSVSIVGSVACALLAAQFGFVFQRTLAIPSDSRMQKVAAKTAKTELWAAVFFAYCGVSALFWACGAVACAVGP